MSPCFRVHGWILSGLCVCEYLRNEIMNMLENHDGSLQLIKILSEAWTFLHGNYSGDSEGHSCGHLVTGSFIMATCLLVRHVSCRVFGEASNHPGDSAPLQPRFGTLRLLAFPKTKITFEREEISDHQWDSGKHNRAADGDWENCVMSQGAYFEGDWGIMVLCTMFLQ